MVSVFLEKKQKDGQLLKALRPSYGIVLTVLVEPDYRLASQAACSMARPCLYVSM